MYFIWKFDKMTWRDFKQDRRKISFAINFILWEILHLQAVCHKNICEH